MQKFGIDVSRWQGDFDFQKAKNDEKIEFAIIKCGGGDDGLYTDSQFINNYNKCTALGLDKGFYFFGNAKTLESANLEAKYILSLIKDKRFEYPIFYDVEGSMLNLDKRLLTDIVKRVLETVEKEGYWVGIYTSASPFNTKLIDSELKNYTHWVASYTSNKPSINSGSNVDIWQYGGTPNEIRSNKINGQVVDQNYCYVDFPSQIKSKKLNGYNGTVTPTVNPTNTITPKFKNGDKVKLNQGAKWYNGVNPAAFVYNSTLYVRSTDSNGIVSVSTISASGAETGKANQNDLTLFAVTPNPTPTPTPTPTPKPNTSIKFKKGDKVKMINGAKWSNGSTPASFIYDAILYVKNDNGTNVEVSTISADGTTTGVARQCDFTLYGSNPTPVINPVVTPTVTNGAKFANGTKVKLIQGAKWSNGSTPASFVYNTVLYVKGTNNGIVSVSTISSTGTETGKTSQNNLYAV